MSDRGQATLDSRPEVVLRPRPAVDARPFRMQNSKLKILDLIALSREYLERKGLADARLNAELLLAGALGLRRLDLYLQFERPILEGELAEFRERLRRRAQGEPLQYIEGVAHFRELELRVDQRALIPRPETEVLVEEVLAWSSGREGADVVDIGTGSGAIALSLRKEGQFGRIVATDRSRPALDLARENRERATPKEEIDFREGDLFEPISGDRFDVIVSNPPYIGERERGALAGEVVHWEPGEALFAGPDGLDVIRELVAGAPRHLRPGGLLALEIGAAQAPEVARMVRENPSFREPIVRRDLANRERVILAEVADREPGPRLA